MPDVTRIGPVPPVTVLPQAATAKESADILKAALEEVTNGAERAGKVMAEFSKVCHKKYGRGAFTVHFESLAAARDGRCLAVDEWLKASVRRSSSYPFPPNVPVPAKVLDAARAFAADCAPEGQLSQSVIYRRAEKLMQQIPAEGSSETREALQSYDPSIEVCICGEVPASEHDDIFTVAAKLPLGRIGEKQREQRKQWKSAREHVLALKSWGNEEIKDKEVGTDLAAKTYREALRILLDTKMEDSSVELALRLNLAEAVGRLGQWQESYEECCSALKLDPTNVKALFRRGRALRRLGRTEEAREDLTCAAKAAPQDRRVREELEAARRCSAGPGRCAPDLRGQEGTVVVLVNHALGGARRMMAALRNMLLQQTSGLPRQLVFVMVLMLALNGLFRLRRRRAIFRIGFLN